MITETAPVDGRTRRRRRNIDAVVDAVVGLAQAGNLDPTSEEIASIAGISHRSIYRYFDTRADLLEAAVARSFDSVSTAAFDGADDDGSFSERVEVYVAARVDVYRRLRSIALAASLHASGTTASVGLERARSAMRLQFADCFAEELELVDADERLLLVPVVDAAFQFEALDYLSVNVGLDDEQIRQSLSLHLHRHLGRR